MMIFIGLMSYWMSWTAQSILMTTTQLHSLGQSQWNPPSVWYMCTNPTLFLEEADTNITVDLTQ